MNILKDIENLQKQLTVSNDPALQAQLEFLMTLLALKLDYEQGRV